MIYEMLLLPLDKRLIHHARGITMVLEPGSKPRGMQQNAIDFDGPISFIGTAVEIAEMITSVVGEDVQDGGALRSNEPNGEASQ